MRATVTRLTACRACASPRLRRFLHLPDMPFTDEFIPADELGREFRHDIDVFVCEDCLTAQTQHDVDVRDYYEDYQYSVGASPTAALFMRQLAHGLVDRHFEGRGAGVRVLEVGSGDGGQLTAFRELGCDVLGFEPSGVLCRAAEAKGVPSIQGLFDAGSAACLPETFQRVDVVMLSYTFDHLPRPREFLAAARSILDPDRGLLVIEVHDLEQILERREFCLFEHEHAIYLTERTAAGLCAREGLTVVDFDPVPRHQRRANSLVFVATPRGSRHDRGPAPVRTPAALADLDDLDFYARQAAEIEGSINRLDAFVERATARGGTLAGYGAGGRGVMTLAAMRTAGRMRYLADRKPKRAGVVVPKSGVPLVGLEALRDDPVDRVLVFSFGYLKEIAADLAAYGYTPDRLHSLLEVLAGRDPGPR